MITANPPNPVATAQGHLDRTRRSMRSTKPTSTAAPTTIPTTSDPSSPDTDATSDSPYSEDEYQHIFVKLLPMSTISHADITGRFPHASQAGNQYILLSIWCGYIHFELMKNRSATEFVRAYQATITFHSKLGKRIDIMRLDNETSTDLDTYLRTAVKSVQYVPAHNHRANNAERAWRTAKNHIIATLCTADKDFPMRKWDGLMEQIEITINLLRPFRPNSSISAYHGMHGHAYNFDSHPLAPPGIKVLIYESPQVRASWAPHGVLGYYLGPALSHHRTFRVHCVHTCADRISDSLAWFPVPYRMPGSSVAEILLAQISDLNDAHPAVALHDCPHPRGRTPTLCQCHHHGHRRSSCPRQYLQPDANPTGGTEGAHCTARLNPTRATCGTEGASPPRRCAPATAVPPACSTGRSTA